MLHLPLPPQSRYHMLSIVLLLLVASQQVMPTAAFLTTIQMVKSSSLRRFPSSTFSSSVSMQSPNNDVEGGGFDPSQQQQWSFQDVSFHHLEEDPLTTGSKRRKEVELQLLEHLKESDSPIDPLIDLWSSERQDAAAIFESMEQVCSPGLKEEEMTLRQMIDESEMEWAEPMVRLSLLFFVKGQYEESLHWCQKALDLKPWHFEGGRLLVVLHLRMGEFGQALQVARRHLLPALNDRTSNKRRIGWVNEVMNKAMLILKEAEMAASTKRQDEYLDADECPIIEGNFLCWE
mmetsp:Transcript_43080/g.104267  ORF Transcript_43080/g.104267 Transcript_43080/m.104267 type:complete len:290 (+) Transcript_43080:37-906(+)